MASGLVGDALAAEVGGFDAVLRGLVKVGGDGVARQ